MCLLCTLSNIRLNWHCFLIKSAMIALIWKTGPNSNSVQHETPVSVAALAELARDMGLISPESEARHTDLCLLPLSYYIITNKKIRTFVHYFHKREHCNCYKSSYRM